MSTKNKKIILLKECYLGKIGDLIKVKPGYARNFLIPREYALPFSSTNNSLIQNKIEEIKINFQKNLDKVQELKSAILQTGSLLFESPSTDDGILYSSLHISDIVDYLNEKISPYSIPNKSLKLKNRSQNIKKIGSYDCEIDLGYEQKAEIKINVENQ
jgi:large subunit ribosomal protein L9